MAVTFNYSFSQIKTGIHKIYTMLSLHRKRSKLLSTAPCVSNPTFFTRLLLVFSHFLNNLTTSLATEKDFADTKKEKSPRFRKMKS